MAAVSEHVQIEFADMPAGSSDPQGNRRLHDVRARSAELLGAGLATARARITLRTCHRLGYRPRLYGRCSVYGGSGIEIGDSFLMLSRTVPGELGTHQGGRLQIGSQVFVNCGASISAHTLVRVGNRCKIGQHAIILDCDFHDTGHPSHDGGHGSPKPVILEDDVWLAARVTVLKGVTVGRGSVVGAGSVVTHDVPAGVVACGVPARVQRRLR
jgi:acetyltransferase-like isoleucine patch superfamily enzyme